MSRKDLLTHEKYKKDIKLNRTVRMELKKSFPPVLQLCGLRG